MATQTARGAKRTCQNEECGVRFYDLMHDPIKCPSCQTVFVPPRVVEMKPKPTWKPSRNVPRHAFVAPAAVEPAEEGEAADLESIETGADDDTEAGSEKSDLILELDEDDDAGATGVVNGAKKD